MAAASTSRATSVPKRSGKENAAPGKVAKKPSGSFDDDLMNEGDSFGEMSGDDAATKAPKPTKAAPTSSRPLKPTKSRQDEDEDEHVPSSGRASELEMKLKAMTAERDRLRAQRDTFSKQFEELSKLRNTSAEELLGRYKEKAALQAKAQSDLIANLSTLNEKLQSRTTSLEKALKEATTAALEPPAKADPTEVKLLKAELSKTQASLKEQEAKYVALEKEHQAEVAHSQSLLRRSRSGPPPSAAPSNPEEMQKDVESVKLYEDLTDLSIVNVKIKEGKAGKERTFNCVQTVGRRSLQFKLKIYNEISQTLLAAKESNPWVKQVLYMPEGLENESDKAFVRRLGMFATQFTLPVDQLCAFWNELRANLEGSEGEGEED